MPEKRTEGIKQITQECVATLESILKNKSALYYEFKIPKKSGESRVITPSKPPLKNIQHRINKYFARKQFPACVHGYVRNRNVLTNAQSHVGKKWVITIDLKDFFPSCDTIKISQAFLNIFSNDQTINLLTELVTFNNQLPQGTPTSPIISNLVLHNLDQEFVRLSKKHGFTYTRYADDLTLSTNGKNPHDFLKAFTDIITSNGFKINPDKLKVMPCSARQIVTGFVVNKYDGNGFLKPTKKYISDFKILIRNCYQLNMFQQIAADQGKTVPKLKRSIEGKILYIKHANPALAREISNLRYPLKPSATEITVNI
ncbi:MAG: RNA-directed DNA polymerase [Veillonellaceae bacterium]|nr:RNA-directed DNA polymerase [Veillonellaceae bacterium]